MCGQNPCRSALLTWKNPPLRRRFARSSWYLPLRLKAAVCRARRPCMDGACMRRIYAAVCASSSRGRRVTSRPPHHASDLLRRDDARVPRPCLDPHLRLVLAVARLAETRPTHREAGGFGRTRWPEGDAQRVGAHAATAGLTGGNRGAHAHPPLPGDLLGVGVSQLPDRAVNEAAGNGTSSALPIVGLPAWHQAPPEKICAIGSAPTGCPHAHAYSPLALRVTSWRPSDRCGGFAMSSPPR